MFDILIKKKKKLVLKNLNNVSKAIQCIKFAQW
jgi:hypothetical protein